VFPVDLPDDPGKMMADDGIADFFAADDPDLSAAAAFIDDEVPIGDGMPSCVDPLETGTVFYGIDVFQKTPLPSVPEIKESHLKEVAYFTVRTFLPLALLADKTFLPPAVAILARKP